VSGPAVLEDEHHGLHSGVVGGVDLEVKPGVHDDYPRPLQAGVLPDVGHFWRDVLGLDGVVVLA